MLLQAAPLPSPQPQSQATLHERGCEGLSGRGARQVGCGPSSGRGSSYNDKPGEGASERADTLTLPLKCRGLTRSSRSENGDVKIIPGDRTVAAGDGLGTRTGVNGDRPTHQVSARKFL